MNTKFENKTKLEPEQITIDYNLRGSGKKFSITIRDNDYNPIAFESVNIPIDSIAHWVDRLVNQGIILHGKSNVPREIIHSRQVFIQYSTQLYQALIQPIEQYLNTKKIEIIPQRALLGLPFDLLLKSKPEPPAIYYNDYHFFGEDHFIYYGYSTQITQLQERIQFSHEDSLKVLAMAPFFEPGPASSFHPIAHSKNEIDSIGLYFPCTQRINEAANLNYFVDHAPQFGVIHLSTHGFYSALFLNKSYLAFRHSQDVERDSLFYLNTIMYRSTTIPAQLLVLSACATQVVDVFGSDDSLASQFVPTGVQSIVASLWEVDDAATAVFMASFYRALSQRKPKDEALKIAQKSLFALSPKYQHPFYWAAFVGYGNRSALVGIY